MKKVKSSALLTILDSGKEYAFLLQRKSIKRAYLRVCGDGTLAVSAPMRMPEEQLRDFLRTQLGFIDNARAKLATLPPQPQIAALDGEQLRIFDRIFRISLKAGNRAYVREGTYDATTDTYALILTVKDPANARERIALLKKYLRECAAQTLTALVDECLPYFAPTPSERPELLFRWMTSRWGICRPARQTVTLNTALVLCPTALCRYVVCHELAHFRHPDHSAAFWAHLSGVMPDCKTRRAALRTIVIPRFTDDP